MLLVLGAEALWMKPWQRELSATEQHEKFEQLRQVINEDRLEDGWVGPPRDQVRRRHHD